MIRILILNNHPAVRQSLQTLLGTITGMTCIATTPNHHHAITLAEQHQPDVIVIDLPAPNHDLAATASRIRALSPNTKIIIQAGWDGPQHRRQALNAGASAHLLKDSHPDQLLQAIRDVAAG
jgi:DNA-binding NarL/FixJ family response regulator